MQLLVVRHGIAQERGTPGVRSDADRVLTDEGRRKTTLAAKGLRAVGCAPGIIGTSPYARAAETAEIIADVLASDRSVETCPFLEPGGDVDDLVDWLRDCDDESAMIVGHMPDLAEMTIVLLTNGGDFDMQFKKAAACCLEFDGPPALGMARLVWLMQPRQLRALADP